MIYSNFQGKKLSKLAFGCMRLPITNGQSDIDEQATAEMVQYAMQQGINYYDTAWGYHNGQSEIVMGKILSAYPRDSFLLATKFPGYDLSNMGKVEQIFQQQLQKCRVEYFDFYLIHNVCEMNIDSYLDEKYGIMDYLLEQKQKGTIKHLGFSAHGGIEVIKAFLQKYGQYMEYCQLQINYIDWHFQNAKGKVELLDSYNIPIWVMEPLRGGKLAQLDSQDEMILKQLRPDASIPSWAFAFLQSIPQVKVILSGMSNMQQLQENIATFAQDNPLDETEKNTLLQLADRISGRTKLPCTACQYCTSHCPKGLDIPAIIQLYNEDCLTGGGFIAPMTIGTYPQDKRPSACVGCKGCEKVCPQSIKISEMMSDFCKRLKL